MMVPGRKETCVALITNWSPNPWALSDRKLFSVKCMHPSRLIWKSPGNIFSIVLQIFQQYAVVNLPHVKYTVHCSCELFYCKTPHTILSLWQCGRAWASQCMPRSVTFTHPFRLIDWTSFRRVCNAVYKTIKLFLRKTLPGDPFPGQIIIK